MGDVQQLLEDAEDKLKTVDQDELYHAVGQDDLTLQGFAKQLAMVEKLGSLRSIIRYFPGVAQIDVPDSEIDRSERDMKKFKALINSMTVKERCQPDIIDASRTVRIERGAGAPQGSLKLLLERFKQTQQYVKLLKR
jgi:signal recognition particle subunit SRP54